MSRCTEQIEILYREAGPVLLTFFRQRFGLAAAAEDLLQDTFVRALRHPERLAAAASPRAYLFGIARHVCQDALRRSLPSPHELTEGNAGAAAEAEDARLESVRQAISLLPEGQREALQLKLQHGLSYEEIAAALGIPVGTVRSRIHHAVRSLRATFHPHAGETS